ncbi:DM13 domain-containing protein [Lentilitoribacter sp. Alg239-R112]|uniref:DM13 domain-containing protein n=1 Tax=Lentilitoribacter sp. Alg239-R112 TaxID=2305987 RepID=UPI0013A68FE4|nr:DM13 domain-containing protein [Lentilitoribacter sp. Alg239-R112]
MKKTPITLTVAALTIFAAPLSSNTSQFFGINSAQAESMSVATGMIKGAGGNYQGEGNVKIVKKDDGKFAVELSDFSSTSGPDLKVFLVAASGLKKGADVIAGKHVNLGALKSTTGSQSYDLPEGANPKDFNSVAIFCEKYTVLFSSADLK